MDFFAKVRENGVVWIILVLMRVGSRRVPTVKFTLEDVGELNSLAVMITTDGIRGTVIRDTMLWGES